MKIGAMRKQVVVQAEQPTADGAGGYALAWAAVATVWAEIKPVSGREILMAGQQQGRVTHKIIMRWRKDFALTTDMRLLCGARVFNIRSIINEGERDRQATLLVEEGGPA